MKKPPIQHITHYIKVEISEALSARFFIRFQDRPEYEGKWYIVNHFTKHRIPTNYSLVKEFLKKSTGIYEIQGQLDRFTKAPKTKGRRYRKIVRDLQKDTYNIFYE